jgi:hypothetical protein
MPAHRLVALGDSLTHGFQSFAIYNTDRSYPKLIAECLGLSDDEFRVPSYRPTSGEPNYMGPALNLEYMARAAGEGDCTEKSLLEQMEIGVKALKSAVDIRIHWDDRARIDELKIDALPADGDIVHNLSVAGFDVGDLMARTADTDIATLHQWAEFTDLGLVATNARALISLPVLKTARRGGKSLTPVKAAQALGAEGGIENLIVFIGANNALGTVISMDVRPSGPGYDSLSTKSQYNLWLPEHFKIEFTRLAGEIKKVGAQRVFVGTVPHVTAAPLAHGVRGRMPGDPEFFRYYTYPWIPPEEFDPAHEAHLLGEQAKLIDGYIDSYNETIRAVVQEASSVGLNWRVVDICKRMDSVAYQRYWDPDESEKQLPELRDVRRKKGISDQDEYVEELPEELRKLTARGALTPSQDDPVRPSDSRFFSSDKNGRLQGGLVALDGVHPTTIGYGVIAQEFLDGMIEAKVPLRNTKIDFADLVKRDSLISNPPECARPEVRGLGWGMIGWDWVHGFAKTMNRPSPRHLPRPFVRASKS